MKRIITISMFAFSGMLAIISLSSSKTASTGVMGQASQNQGCGSCHGNSASAATVINVTGIPAAGYTPGTMYPVTLTITNNNSMMGAGFDLFFTAGAISGAPAGTMTMMANKELHHIQRFPMTSGVCTINFNWTAPAAGGLVTLTVAGNAVNGNDQNSGDQWNKSIFTYNAAPNSVTDVATETISVYPNPASTSITLDSKNQAPITGVVISNLSGQRFDMPVLNQQGKLNIEVASLASGFYQISYYQQGMVHRTSFVKK